MEEIKETEEGINIKRIKIKNDSLLWMGTFSLFPLDMIQEIISFLDFKSATSLGRTCKKIHALTNKNKEYSKKSEIIKKASKPDTLRIKSLKMGRIVIYDPEMMGIIGKIGYEGHVDMIEILWNKGWHRSLFEDAFLQSSASGKIRVVKFIVSKNYDFGAEIIANAVLLACRHGNWGIAELLFESYGIDKYGEYGLFGAAMAENWTMMKCLIERNVHSWEKGLIGGIMGGHKSVVEYFIGLGAKNFNTAINSAIWSHNSEMAAFIEEKKKSVMK